MPANLQKKPPSESDLERDVEQFFTNAVNHYLSDQMQLVYKRIHPSKIRDPIELLNQFIDRVKKSDLAQKTLEPNLAIVDKWKKEFTKKILLKYLEQNYIIPLPHLIELIKKAIVAAATNNKIEYYTQLCKVNLLSSLKTVDTKSRLVKAEYIVQTSFKEIQKKDHDLSEEKFLSAFSKESLKELVDKIPLEKKSLLTPEENELIKKIERKMASYLQDKISKSAGSLTSKLHLVNEEIIHLKMMFPELIDKIKGWVDSDHLSKFEVLIPFIKEACLNVILKQKAEILLRSCQAEINEAKEKGPFDSFPKRREAILKKYISCYIQSTSESEQIVKDNFLSAFKDDESAKFLQHLPEPSETLKKLPPRPPKKQKKWDRV